MTMISGGQWARHLVGGGTPFAPELNGKFCSAPFVTRSPLLFDAGPSEKPMLQSVVCEFSCQRPSWSGRLSSIQIILYRTSGDPERHGNLAYACPAGREPQHLYDVSDVTLLFPLVDA